MSVFGLRRGFDPFTDMRRVHREVNRLFEALDASAAGGAFPPVNLSVGEHAVALSAELPGVAEGDLNVTAQEQTLTIAGERKAGDIGEGASWRRRERAFGTFSRTIELPFRIDPATVKARLADGVLEVELHRPAADQPRKIAVQAG